MSKETKSYMKKIYKNKFALATILSLASFDLSAQSSIQGVPCPSCVSQDLGWVQTKEECLYDDGSTGFPSKEKITHKGCAIPANYSEYCANGDPNRCKLLNPIRPPKTELQIGKAIIGWCPYGKKEGNVTVCKKEPRYRTSVINTRTEYGCQITAYEKICNSKDGLLGPSMQTVNPPILVGKEVVKSVTTDCFSYDDPPCRQLACPPGSVPPPGGGGPQPGPAAPGTPTPRGPTTGGPTGPSSPGPSGPSGEPPAGVVPTPVTGARSCPSGWSPAPGIPRDSCTGSGKNYIGPTGKPFWDGKGWRIDTQGGVCCVRNPTTGPVDCPKGTTRVPGGPEECKSSGGGWVPPPGDGRSGACCKRTPTGLVTLDDLVSNPNEQIWNSDNTSTEPMSIQASPSGAITKPRNATRE